MVKKDKLVRKLTITGETRSYYVTLPKDIIRHLKWRKGQKLTVKRRGSRIIISNKT